MKFDLTTYVCFMGILALHFHNSTYLCFMGILALHFHNSTYLCLMGILALHFHNSTYLCLMGILALHFHNSTYLCLMGILALHFHNSTYLCLMGILALHFHNSTYLCFVGILALHFHNSTYLSSDTRDVSTTISDITQAWLGESPHSFLTQKKTNIVSNPWLAMLLLAGDVQSNPGPGCSYPCTVSQRNVRDKDAAVSCDLCNGWSHTVCVGISDEEYGNLMDQNSFNFFCHKCTLAELPSYPSSPERELNDTDSTIDHI